MTDDPETTPADSAAADPASAEAVRQPVKSKASAELGGPKGPEPTRYGDWERKGRCVDF